MTLNLLERGLADIYNRQAFLMSPDNLLANRPDPVSRETRSVMVDLEDRELADELARRRLDRSYRS